jgi:hypothetical protein
VVAGKGAAVVDQDDQKPAVFEIGHLDVDGEGQVLVGGGEAPRVESLPLGVMWPSGCRRVSQPYQEAMPSSW